ncbi:uncharacterized protein [Pocillopora verrucosa]|uniref:uncharacterized protein n=1 Tax=Pocillopora verrucosa TaxID=203993 RepID=UPI00333F8CB5
MKSYLFVSFLAVAISASQGFRSFQLQDPTEDPSSGLPDAPSVIAPTEIATPNPKPHDRNCDCNGVCNDLNEERLPPYLQDETKYLSYENFPVLCRDASAILLPPGEEEQKKYVCKQTFDCCRDCNNVFYRCLARGTVYGRCMRGAYTCMCQCIDERSFDELPFQRPVALPAESASEAPPQVGPGETK